MGSVNKWIGIGNLGADPELKYTDGGKPVCNLRIACTETWKDKSGTKQERTEWVRVTVWGQQAESCGKFLAKGRSVYVEGRLQTRSYEKDGQKHYSTDIIADNVVFLGSGDGPKDRPARGASTTQKTGGRSGYAPATPDEHPAGDSDIPF